MAQTPRSTLSEVNMKLAEVCYAILNAVDSTRWKDSKQIVYSTVTGWDTAYESYLVYRRIDNVKFPFAALTREGTQDTYKLWNKHFVAHEQPTENNFSVKAVYIKPVRATYVFSIYDKDMESVETFADIIMTQGHLTQRLLYDSAVLEQPSEISFNFGEPQHEMIPDKAEKRKGRGFIYGLNIPIVVDCVLGIKAEEKLIAEAISSVLPRLPDTVPDDISQEPDSENEIITE